MIAILSGSVFSEGCFRVTLGRSGMRTCHRCGMEVIPLCGHVVWACPRFGREYGRPQDSLAARIGWPARPEGLAWNVRDLNEVKGQ
eukprot:13264238-Alexandrium_andersonii.AAC.1